MWDVSIFLPKNRRKKENIENGKIIYIGIRNGRTS